MNTKNDQQESWDTQDEPQLMLRLNCEDRVKLLPYAYLIEVTLEVGKTSFLKLEFSSCVVEITGDGLDEMLFGLQKHYISCLRIGTSIKEIKVSGTTSANS
jgi:hypothetical protein